MATSELSSLYLNIANQIRLCKCVGKVDEIVSNDEKFDSKESYTCSSCKIAISPGEKDIIHKMKAIFHTALQDIGIDLNTIPMNDFAENYHPSENVPYTINCDLKYLKRNSKGETLLHSAARKKDLQSIRTMLKQNVNPNTQDNAGWTPLHEAVFSDNLDIALELLSAGAIVNVPGYEFTTPLHVAVDHNQLEMVKLLLQFGANPNLRDINGQYPENLIKSSDMLPLLKEYSEYSDVIEMSKRFQKKIAPKQLTVYLFGEDLLSIKEQQALESNLAVKFCKRLGKEITHIVVKHIENNICEPKFEILKGILMGCAIVNVRWLLSCLNRNRLANFSDYEINGTTKFPYSNGLRRARNNFLEMNPALFTGCSIFLKVKKDINNLKELVTCSGAKLLNREPNPEHSPSNNFLFHCEQGHSMESTTTLILYENGPHEPTLKYNMAHLKSMPVQWFFDCIQSFSIRKSN